MGCAHTALVDVNFYHRAAPKNPGLRTPAGGDFAYVECACGESYYGVPLWISARGIPGWVTRAIAKAKEKH